jgi:hypothetical protein
MTTSGSHPEMMEMLTEGSDHSVQIRSRATILLSTAGAVVAGGTAGSDRRTIGTALQLRLPDDKVDE